MKWDLTSHPWRQLKRRVKQRWDKLTDADLGSISGNREELANILQHRYGFERDQAERDVREFLRSQAAKE